MPNTGSLATQVCSSLKRAQKVLYGISLQGLTRSEREQALVKAYANLREQGFTCIVQGCTDPESFQCSWAEERGSDRLVVYEGRPSGFNRTCGVPDRDAYTRAKFFKTEKQAAKYISARVREACKIAEKSYQGFGVGEAA